MILASERPPGHRLYAMMGLKGDGSKVYLRPTSFDTELFEEAGARLERAALPLSDMTVRPGHNTNQARGYNYRNWRDFFNGRQLLCLGILLARILKVEDKTVRNQFLCLLSSTLEFNNLFCSFKGEGTGAVRPLFSHHILKPERTVLENSVWGTDKSSGTFSTLFRSRLLKAKQYLEKPFEVGRPHGLFEEAGQNDLANWVKRAKDGDLPAVNGAAGTPRHIVTGAEAELSRLRRENAELRMERDILKKSAAYFASESLRGTR